MKSLEEQLDDYKKMNKAKNAFIAGLIQGWCSRLQACSSNAEIVMVIKDMKEVSDQIAKSAGVIIYDEE